MTKLKTKKAVVIIAVLLLFIASYLIYSRPMTIQQRYCSIYDLLPRGTRIHREEPGDFQWEVYFYFKDIEFPDGSMGAGEMLRVQNWYGDLDIYFDGKRLTCYTDEQENWIKEVFDSIR